MKAFPLAGGREGVNHIYIDIARPMILLSPLIIYRRITGCKP